ncbi:hypothetical protein Tco_1266356 [Tanacetum coccineum]
MGGRRHQHCDRLATVQQQISDRTLTLKITCSCLQWCDEDLSKSSRGDLDFVSFREMVTSQPQGKLWLYDEVPGGAHEDKDEDFRRSPYKDKDTEDIRRSRSRKVDVEVEK